jgi:hypothetical protein
MTIHDSKDSQQHLLLNPHDLYFLFSWQLNQTQHHTNKLTCIPTHLTNIYNNYSHWIQFTNFYSNVLLKKSLHTTPLSSPKALSDYQLHLWWKCSDNPSHHNYPDKILLNSHVFSVSYSSLWLVCLHLHHTQSILVLN